MPVQRFICSGGLDTESAVFDIQAGYALSLFNVEVDVNGTYTTMAGIEKLDGRIEPNKATYQTVVMGSVAGFSAGQSLTASSGWTALCIGVDSSSNVLGVINASGTLVAGNTIAGVQVVDAPSLSEARSYSLHRSFRAYMQNYYRGLIQAVPGVNDVRGVVIYAGNIYAFRDHSDNTTCRMYKATTSGWVEVATSGSLLKNGNYSFAIHNFKASAGTQWLIITNGVNKAVRYDGATCVQLSTGMPTDTPSSCAVLPSSVLLLGYENGSVMTSKVGDPTDFTVGSGGSELGMSDVVVGMALQPDEKVAIFCKNSIRILSGRSTASFVISVFNADAGAVKGSIANIGDSIFLSQTGLTRLSRSQAYGSFEMSAMDKKIRSLISNSSVLFSLSVRRKNQYRLFYPNGFVGLTLSGNDVVGAFTGKYPVKMSCGYSAEISGEEYVLLGGSDGFVYRADVGQSHAGAAYSRTVRMAHNDLRLPQVRKEFKRLTINADSDRLIPVDVSVELDYSSGDAPRQSVFSAAMGGNEAILGQMILGTPNAILGSASASISQLHIVGTGRAISPIFNIYSADLDTVRFGGYSIEYEKRAKVR